MTSRTNPTQASALADVRVLDLAGPLGVYCTKLLADLGADVIKIEPPDGDPARNLGPFYHDKPHPEKSLYWFHMNTNKRSITLNLNLQAGKNIFKQLVTTSDIVVETFRPGYLEEKGLGYPTLYGLNSGLILTSITGFGQTGPWKNYKACDIVGLALGGLLHVCGFPDKPPIRMAGSQAYHQVSVQAAAGTLIALYHRLVTGKGQHVDVSMQQSIPICLQTRTIIYEKTRTLPKRIGEDRTQAAYGIFPCKDGYIDIRIQLPNFEPLVKWMDSEGMAADLGETKWSDPFYRNTSEAIQHINEVLSAFLKTHTKREIYEEGQRRGLVIGPVNSVAEVVKDPPLEARQYFIELEHPELRASLKYLGAPYRLSETPWSLRRRAPLVGEHNSEIYQKELGFPRQELVSLKQTGVI